MGSVDASRLENSLGGGRFNACKRMSPANGLGRGGGWAMRADSRGEGLSWAGRGVECVGEEVVG